MSRFGLDSWNTELIVGQLLQRDLRLAVGSRSKDFGFVLADSTAGTGPEPAASVAAELAGSRSKESVQRLPFVEVAAVDCSRRSSASA